MKPIMEFIGVRSSWLILARKSALALTASSAASLAMISSLSSFLCFEISDISASSILFRSMAYLIERARIWPLTWPFTR